MKLWLKTLYAFLGICLIPVFADASFYSDEKQSCYTDDDGCDEFWYCGAPRNGNKKCYDNKPWGCDDTYFYIHGDSFKAHDRKFWCCDGTSDKTGQFKEGSAWITETKIVKETVTGGTCTWQQKINICGKVDNPGDKCTVATGDCTAGYVSHNGKCVAACGEGQAFISAIDSTCIPCEQNETQGIVKGVCKKCESNEVFSKTKLSCVKYSDMLQIATVAHDECWMCVTPGAMYNCLEEVSEKGHIVNPKLQKACSVEAKDSDATDFVIPDNYVNANIKRVLSAYLNGVVLSDTELQNILANWNENMGSLVINYDDGTKEVRTKRKHRTVTVDTDAKHD